MYGSLMRLCVSFLNLTGHWGRRRLRPCVKLPSPRNKWPSLRFMREIHARGVNEISVRRRKNRVGTCIIRQQLEINVPLFNSSDSDLLWNLSLSPGKLSLRVCIWNEIQSNMFQRPTVYKDHLLIKTPFLDPWGYTFQLLNLYIKISCV